jgi:hypothetical protein
VSTGCPVCSKLVRPCLQRRRWGRACTCLYTRFGTRWPSFVQSLQSEAFARHHLSNLPRPRQKGSLAKDRVRDIDTVKRLTSFEKSQWNHQCCTSQRQGYRCEAVQLCQLYGEWAAPSEKCKSRHDCSCIGAPVLSTMFRSRCCSRQRHWTRRRCHGQATRMYKWKGMEPTNRHSLVDRLLPHHLNHYRIFVKSALEKMAGN